MLKLISTIAVASVAAGKAVEEQEKFESPVVEAGKFPENGWAIFDWTVGLTMGAYGPLSAYAREDDCFSSWYDWGSITIGFSHYFDKKFKTDSVSSWIFLAITMFFFIKSSINLPQVCYDELKYAKETEWHNNYGFLAEDVALEERPTVRGGGYDRNSVSWNILTVIKIVLKSLKVWKNFKSEFWFWELGESMGNLASTIVVASMTWANSDTITPQPAYLRYLDN